MKKIGEILKSEREKKGYSLQEVGLSLKINPKTLMHLEEGQTDKLPAKTFLRGFIRSYANYLKLNTEEILKLFNEEMGIVTPVPLLKLVEEKVDSSAYNIEPPPAAAPKIESLTKEVSHVPRRSGPSLNAILVVLLLLLVIVVGIVAEKLIHKYEKEKATAAVTPVPVTESATAPNPPVETLSNGQALSRSSQMTDVSPTDNMLTPKDLVLAAPVDLEKKENKEALKGPLKPAEKVEPKKPETAPTKTEKLTSNESDIKVENPPPPPPEKVEEKPVEKNDQEVIIEATKDTTISFKIDEKDFETVELKTGNVYTIKAKDKIVLSLKDVSGTNIFANGKELKSSDKEDGPKTFNFP